VSSILHRKTDAPNFPSEKEIKSFFKEAGKKPAKFAKDNLLLSDWFPDIIESDLHPHQKVHAYNTFIHSQLPFHLRHGRIPLANFVTNNKNAPAYDPAIRQLFVWNFGLIKGALVDFFYASKEAGGAQIANTLDEYLIQSIVYIMRLVNNNDSRLVAAIKNDLIQHLAKLKIWTSTILKVLLG